MTEHSRVEAWEPLDNDAEYVYLITRRRGLPDVRVHVSDAYEYTRAECLARPAEVTGQNSFVVLRLPEAYAPGEALLTEAKSAGLGIGKIGKFMRALNSPNVSE
jgi:hypothetical protein